MSLTIMQACPHFREYCRSAIIRAMIPLCFVLPILGCSEAPPEVTVPGIPPGDYCLTRINKSLDGFLHSDLLTSYDCPTGKTERRSAKLTVRVFSNGGPACDEPVPRFVETVVLDAEGTVVVRSDSLAHFLGQFLISTGDGDKLLEGTIEIIGRIGTHQQSHLKSCDELCSQDKHIEGWLVGRGLGEMSKYTLRAVLAIDMSENLPASSLISPSSRLVGVLIEGA